MKAENYTYVKVPLDETELKILNEECLAANLTLPMFIKSCLPLPEMLPILKFRKELSEAKKRAEKYTIGKSFEVPNLYTGAEYNELCTSVGIGVFGKEFFRQAEAGKIKNVKPLPKIKGKNAQYMRTE